MIRPRLLPLLGALAMTAASALTFAQPLGDGFKPGKGDDRGFRIYPWLNLLMAYDTNYYRTNNSALINNPQALGAQGVALANQAVANNPQAVPLRPMATWENVVEPGVRLTASNGVTSAYNLSYFARIGSVTASPADNFTDQRLEADGNWELGIRHRLTADYQYWNWHDRRGSGSPIDSARANFLYPHPDIWSANVAKLGYSYGAPGSRGRLDLNASYAARQYLNNNQSSRDNNQPGADIAFYLRVTPKASALFEVAGQNTKYVRQLPGTISLDSDQLNAYTGVTWEATAKTSGTAKVGWLSKTFAASQRQNWGGVGWWAQMQWRPLTYSTINLATERAPVETNTSTANAILVSSVKLDWIHYWKPRLHTRFGLLGTTDDYIGDTRVDHRYGASGGVFYQMRRWLELGFDYTYASRTSNVPLGAADYLDNVFLLSVRTAY